MRESRRLKLVISYDGRDFAGWQSQKHGNTVQDHLETAFERVCGTRLAVTGSGRTDSGVHALGQCAHVDVPAGQFPAERWLKALNGVLPPANRIFRRRISLQDGANDGGRDGAVCPWERESAINRIALGAAFADIGSFCCSGSRGLPGPGSLLSLCKSGTNAFLRGFRLAN